MRRLPRSWPWLSIVGGLLGVAVPAAAEPEAAGRARISAHHLTVRLEPKTHRLVGKDVIEFDVSKGRSTGPLFIAKVLSSSVPLSSNEAGVHSATLPEGTTKLEVTYEATIYDAVRKSEAAAFVIGDDTKGVIAQEGVYLSERSGWYPTTGDDGLVRFDVTSYVPEPFLVVTQGGVAERSSVVAPAGFDAGTDVEPPAGAAPAAGGVRYAVSKAYARLPADGCELVAGPYKTTSRTVEGIEIATWFFEQHEGAQPIWLDSMEAIVKRYEPILGSYPHPKFDIVENFFSSGYGMPSFTLLGAETIAYVTEGAKRSGGKIPPGYLDHEYVHGWFGNGLFVDPKDGNWCEALTTYFSNYYAKELESPDAAREHRRGILEHFAIRVKGDKDYPLRAFRAKAEDFDNDVGYGKGAMLFHMLRRRLGDQHFFAAVKHLTEKRIGTYVNWDDWLDQLDGAWAKPFLERKGLPAVRLASATEWRPVEDNRHHRLRAEAVVDQPRGEAPWPDFNVPVLIDGRPPEMPPQTLRIEGRSGVLRMFWEVTPGKIELDPDYDVLRRISDDDLPPCLNRTLEGGGAYLVAPSSPKSIDDLAKALESSKGLKRANPVPDSARAIIGLKVLGADETYDFGVGRAAFRADATGLTFEGKRFEGPGHAILISATHKDQLTTWYLACSEGAAARATRVPFYGWDEYVVFKDGRPVTRGRLDSSPKSTTRAFVDHPLAGSVGAFVDRLASDEFEGRAPGTKSHAKLEGYFLPSKIGSSVPVAPEGVFEFPLGVSELVSSRDLVLTTEAGTETLKDAFRPMFSSAEREAGTPLKFPEGAGAVPLPGRLPDTSPEGLALFQEQMAAGTAPAVLVAPSVPARKALAPLLDAPNALTPESIAELDKPGPDGKPRPRPPLRQWIGAKRIRAFPTAKPLRVPVLVLEESTVERLDRAPAVKAIDFAVKFGPERAQWAAGKGGRDLVIGMIPKHLEGPRPPVVVVCAHYDSFGLQNGVLWRGADDNASGVAAAFHAVGYKKSELVDSPDAKAGLLVVFFDGEEWGLQGSRAIVDTLKKAYDVKAVVNVDAVGRVRDDTVYVVGLSKEPVLGPKAAEALKSVGLTVGRDIDQYAYEEGSDHWPFHQAGIPAITLWASDYGTMNSAADDPDKVDPVGVARISSAVRALLLRLTRE